MSEIYLLDTNMICVLADPARANQAEAVQHFQQIGDQNVVLPVPAVGEIEFGMSKAPNVRPEKRQELRTFIARFEQFPFDRHCIFPYAAVRAEIWRMHATPKAGRPSAHKEKRPEDLTDKVTGADLGIDEPDLLIASIALNGNLVLVTDDQNSGMIRIVDAVASVRAKDSSFPFQLRIENWLSQGAGS
jgi:predicted nucleic acid-binding protein